MVIQVVQTRGKPYQLQVELVGSLAMLASLFVVYLDAVKFQTSVWSYTGEDTFGVLDHDYTRRSLYFIFEICGGSCYFAGYSSSLAVYLVLTTIAGLAIFRYSNFRWMVTGTYVIVLNTITYLTSMAFEATGGETPRMVLINTLAMVVAFGLYLRDLRQQEQLSRKSRSAEVPERVPVPREEYLGLSGSFLLLLGYMLLVPYLSYLQTINGGYFVVVLALLVTLPSMEQKLGYVLAVLTLAVSLFTWWLSLFGMVIVGSILTLSYEQKWNLSERGRPFSPLLAMMVGIPIIGFMFVLSIVRAYSLGY